MDQEKELNDITKHINSSNKLISEQNKKINKIDEKVSDVDTNMKVTESYLNGFRSFCGFFPKIFLSDRTNNNKSVNKDDREYTKESNNKEMVSSNKRLPDNLDDADILKQSAKELRSQIKASVEGTEYLENKIDRTNNKVNSLKSKADNLVENNYK
jgi:hypothetical protein